MPRNISFFLTTKQFLDGSKDVTRRNGWRNVKAGDVLCAVEKGQGLGKGGKINRLDLIRVISARQEPLQKMLDNPRYGAIECRREGFPQMMPRQFVKFFLASHRGVIVDDDLTRIEFERIGMPRPLTKPQLRILFAAARSSKGAEVGGRNMAAVNNLKSAGYARVTWQIVHGVQQDRWEGIVKITKAGRAVIKNRVHLLATWRLMLDAAPQPDQQKLRQAAVLATELRRMRKENAYGEYTSARLRDAADTIDALCADTANQSSPRSVQEKP